MDIDIKYVEEDGIIDFFNSLNYGSTSVRYGSESARKKALNVIDIINALNTSEVLEQNELTVTDIVRNEYKQRKIEGAYRILLKSRVGYNKAEESDLKLFDAIVNAKELKDKISVPAIHGLLKFASKKSKSLGVKFVDNGSEWIFNGQPAAKSVYKTLQQGYFSNEKSMKFDISSHSSNTIRCYASSLSKEVGEKITCSVSDGFITVHFKERSEYDVLRDRLSAIFKESCSKMNPDEVSDIFTDIAGTIVIDSLKLDKKGYFIKEPVKRPDYEKFLDDSLTKIADKFDMTKEEVTADYDEDEEDDFELSPEVEAERLRIRQLAESEFESSTPPAPEVDEDF